MAEHALATRIRYRMTMFLTHKPGYPVPVFKSIEEIPKFINWGKDYHPDPWDGKRDPCFHPTHSVKKILTNDKTMSFDCDDHSALWCALLLKGGLAKEVSMGFFGMVDPKGVKSYHCICVFVGNDGKKYWADYGMPTEFTNDWEWAHQSAANYGCKAFTAGIIHVKKLRNDTPILGGYEKTEL